jgi:hypothetical protein
VGQFARVEKRHAWSCPSSSEAAFVSRRSGSARIALEAMKYAAVASLSALGSGGRSRTVFKSSRPRSSGSCSVNARANLCARGFEIRCSRQATARFSAGVR